MAKKMKIQFDKLDYQTEAINSVVDVFRGQEACTSNFTVLAPKVKVDGSYSNLQAETGYANKLELSQEQLLQNTQEIQLRNGLRVSKSNEVSRSSLDFSVEMETGTGKTYVFLRSILEMNKRYGFTKFIIVVPSIPIKEGTNKNLEMTEEHFKGLFDNVPYHYFVYDSGNLSKVRDFAVSDQLRIMVINIQAFARDMDSTAKTRRILLDYNDKLGATPINLIKETNPVVIVDEPQSTLSTALQKKSVQNLNPLAIFRYSATHREKINLLYRLNAVDAYQKKLVKQIEVSSVGAEGEATDGAYLRLVDVPKRKSGIVAKLEIDVLVKGKSQRKVVEVRQNTQLYEVSGLQQYDNFIVQNIYVEDRYIEFSNGTDLGVGETIGGVDDLLLKRLQIRKTIEEHLDKELLLNPQGIKVLSLFFIDSVKNYREYDEEGNATNGIYARIFEEEYMKTIQKRKYESLFKEIKDIESGVSDVHNGYFSIDKVSKKSDKKQKFEAYRDTSGNIKADEDTYSLIMKDKEKLLSFDSKLRFIFSHSALKEGWDNPNVFQICTLKEAGGSEINRRQEIGRGLRLCVNQKGERVYGHTVNLLTVMASETYEDFVKGFQKEVEKETGYKFGYLEEHSFNNIVLEMDGDIPIYLGDIQSKQLFNHLISKMYITKDGKVEDSLRQALLDNVVDLGAEFAEHVEKQILNTIRETAGRLEIKNNSEKKKVEVRKEVYLSADFKELWDKIKYKTTFQVTFDSAKLIEKCIENIDEKLIIHRGNVVYRKGTLDINTGGVESKDEKISVDRLDVEINNLPDIVTYLQNETNLTRRSIVDILTGIRKDRLDLFKINPQKFIEGSIDIINEQMRLHIVDGIKYTKIGDSAVYEQELFLDEELLGYLNSNMAEAKKSIYKHIIYDSGVEKHLAEEFEKSDNVKLYAKLPSWFQIDTPLGSYNPDWAVLYTLEDIERLYFVVESKGSIFDESLRPLERGKITCGEKHFEELGSKLVTVSNIDELNNKILGIN